MINTIQCLILFFKGHYKTVLWYNVLTIGAPITLSTPTPWSQCNDNILTGIIIAFIIEEDKYGDFGPKP